MSTLSNCFGYKTHLELVNNGIYAYNCENGNRATKNANKNKCNLILILRLFMWCWVYAVVVVCLYRI